MERILGSSPNVKIISFLLDHPEEALNMSEIIEGSHIGRNTFYSKIGVLVEEEIVKTLGKERSTLYQLNVNHHLIKYLLTLRREGHL